MDEKIIKFPCTNKCLVYASCTKLCWPYRDYVEEAYRELKYRVFKIVPSPPLQIQQLSELMNRVEDDTFIVKYYPAEDMLIIYNKETFHDRIVPIVAIGRVRKRINLHDHPTFPKELKD